ncbi:hypothetical protein Ciccas_011391 [Cichlidogyrus casuarinus]|uniref:Uncharacterized protein n=1 Tax=Cichlidogyrus casuarinus TaxID=1844966 RepID=A0ABD2PRD2_9PLAT
MYWWFIIAPIVMQAAKNKATVFDHSLHKMYDNVNATLTNFDSLLKNPDKSKKIMMGNERTIPMITRAVVTCLLII